MAQQETRSLVVLEGDQTGQELLLESLRIFDPSVTRLPLRFERFDLSLAARRESQNAVVEQAAKALRRSGLGLKAATITPEGRDDVGSPNAILRERIEARVILRTGRRLPGVEPIAGVHAPISVVRMAVDDAYGAKEWRQSEPDGDELAFRTERISRHTCRAVAEYAFQHAAKHGATVFGGPKFTVSPVYEGMFKEEMDAAAQRHPAVRYDPQLIDSTYALLLQSRGAALVIPALNRDGDCLSDLVLQLFGSIAGSESLVLGFDETATQVRVVMAEAPHGTAPTLLGKNVANPMGMILAGAAVLGYLQTEAGDRVSRAIVNSLAEALSQGVATRDLGGSASTTEFTDSILRRLERKLAAAPSLG